MGKYIKPPTQIFFKLQITTSIQACKMPEAIQIVDFSLAHPEKARVHVKYIPQTQQSKKGSDLTEVQKVFTDCLMEAK